MEKVVYKITNIENGKRYIGSTKNRKKRWHEHKSALKNDRHRNSHLQNAWNKYGENAFKFEVMKEVEKESDLLSWEQFYLDTKEPQYNIAKDAEAPTRGRKHTEETRQKISKNHADMSGENNPMYGKHHSEETKSKISKTRKGKGTGEDNPIYGRTRSRETREKISKANSGKTLTEKHKEKVSKALRGENNPMYGKKRSKAVREKISKTESGKEITKETRQKIGEAHRGIKNINAKLTKKKVKIIKYLLKGKSNFTQKQISKMFGVRPTTISKINTDRTWAYVTI